MKNDSLIRRLRAARPVAVAAELANHDALFARIVADPGDPRLVEGHHRRLPRWLLGRRVRPLVVGAGAFAAAIAAVVLMFGGTLATPPAYALTANGNGSYTLTLNDLTTGIPAINAELKQMGIPATVVPVQAGCTASSFDPVQAGAVSGSQTVTFSSDNIPVGMQMYIAAEQAPESGQVLFAQGTTSQPIPSCFPTTTSYGIPAGS